MPHAELAAAMMDGHVVVTPNKRLARTLIAQHDAAAMARGATAWTGARVLPWSAWLQALWNDLLAVNGQQDARALLSAEGSAWLWDGIVATDSALLDPRGAATSAASAWSIFHAWRAPGETFTAWQHAGIDDDAAAFSRWATRYQDTLAQRQRLDAAQLADVLTGVADRVPAWRDTPVLLAGFLECSPQQQRLLAALEAGGTTLARIALPAARDATCTRTTFATPEAEVMAALVQARDIAIADPDARIGIVISDLAQRRDAILAAADDILCPELAAVADADAPRPYDLSLGVELALVPLVASALHLIEWAAGALPMPVAAAMLRSPYLPGDIAHGWGRAGMERQWREAGVQHVTVGAAVAALPAGDPLAVAWAGGAPPVTGRQTPAAWAQAWRAWLAEAGWPGMRSLGSSEWQARDAWWQVLGAFASLDGVMGVITRDDALAAVRAMAKRAVFQPQARGARIQILGILEATGLSFDRLWIAGMSAGRWPPAAAPQALLPLAWQRDRGVPHADAPRTLAFARAVTATLANAAPVVIASYALREDDAPAAVSSLVAAWPAQPAAVVPATAGRMRAMAATRPVLESLNDVQGPALAIGARAEGGVAVVETQSACPFQAFARYRLRQEAWPDIAAGLGADERGNVLHRVLATFWSGVRSHANLVALTAVDLDAKIAAAVEVGKTALEARRWRALPASVAAAEAERLATITRAWLDTIERERPPFVVDESEQKHALRLGDLEFRIRIDRVDRLPDGSRIVIDYKSGRAPSRGQWFAQRPAGTQVGMYALALQADGAPQEVRAVAYGQMKAGEVKVVGLAADTALWPALPTPSSGRSKLPIADWPGAIEFWESNYGMLASDFRDGAAQVVPRNAQACRYCPMDALCRIERLDDPIIAAEVAADGGGDDGDDA